MDMDKENILSKKDLEFLQEWILQDRNMRKGKIESDFDKFCEEKCVALENLISAFLKTQSGLAESKKIIVNLTNLCDEWADKYLALKSEFAGIEESLRHEKEVADLEAKLAQHEKHNAWVLEFLEMYQIDTELTPEYSENPIVEYCEQVNDFRAVDNKIIEDLQEEKETLRISQSSTHKTLIQLNDELLKTQKELAEKQKELNLTKKLLENYRLQCHEFLKNDFIDQQLKELKEKK